jgi:hypothetical protein
MNEGAKSLLTAVLEAEERRRRYSRWVALFDRLFLALSILTTVFMSLGAVVYFFYGYDYRLPVVIGAVFSIAAYAAYMLSDVYSHRAAKAARQACMFRCVVEMATSKNRDKVGKSREEKGST